MQYTPTTNMLQYLINENVKFFTSPTSPLRNRWLQTFIFCLLIIAVSVGYYYASSENNNKKLPPNE